MAANDSPPAPDLEHFQPAPFGQIPPALEEMLGRHVEHARLDAGLRALLGGPAAGPGREV